MKLHLGEEVPWRALQPRLAELELDLGIVGYQRAAWELFVESFTSILQALRVANTEFMARVADGPPSLAGALHAQICRLSALLEEMRVLAASSENLHRSLTTRQRKHAVHVLGPLCSELQQMISSTR